MIWFLGNPSTVVFKKKAKKPVSSASLPRNHYRHTCFPSSTWHYIGKEDLHSSHFCQPQHFLCPRASGKDQAEEGRQCSASAFPAASHCTAWKPSPGHTHPHGYWEITWLYAPHVHITRNQELWAGEPAWTHPSPSTTQRKERCERAILPLGALFPGSHCSLPRNPPVMRWAAERTEPRAATANFYFPRNRSRRFSIMLGRHNYNPPKLLSSLLLSALARQPNS